MNGIVQKVASGEIKLSSIRMGFPVYSLSGGFFNIISTDVSKDIEYYVALTAQGNTLSKFYYSLQQWKYSGSSQSFAKIDEYSEGSLSDAGFSQLKAINRVYEGKILVCAYSVNSSSGKGTYSTPPVLILQ